MRLIDADYVQRMVDVLNNRAHGDKQWVNVITAVKEIVDNAPTITSTVGQWVELSEETTWQCSNCGDTWRGGLIFNYCPTCGAKMSIGKIK